MTRRSELEAIDDLLDSDAMRDPGSCSNILLLIGKSSLCGGSGIPLTI